jgi:hypothetical protein
LISFYPLISKGYFWREWCQRWYTWAMVKMPRTSYLQRRNGRYRFVRRVPDDLIEPWGKAVVKVSLETSDLREAKSRLAIRNAEFEGRVRLLRQPPPPDPTQGRPLPTFSKFEIEEMALEWFATAQAKALSSDSKLFLSTVGDPSSDLDQEEAILSDRDDPNGRATVAKIATSVVIGRGGRSVPLLKNEGINARLAAGAPRRLPSDDMKSEQFAMLTEYVRRGLLEITRRQRAVGRPPGVRDRVCGTRRRPSGKQRDAGWAKEFF